MSYKEAKEDGVRIESSVDIKYPTFYYPRCVYCQCEIRRTTYNRNITYICKRCKAYVDKIKKLENI